MHKTGPSLHAPTHPPHPLKGVTSLLFEDYGDDADNHHDDTRGGVDHKGGRGGLGTSSIRVGVMMRTHGKSVEAGNVLNTGRGDDVNSREVG